MISIMTTYEEDAPRLAEIGRAINDFRLEFRNTVAQMVRRDVYDAQMQTIGVQMEAMRAEIRRNAETAAQDAARVDQKVDEDRSERKVLRNTTYGAILAAGVSFVTMVVQLMTK